MNISQLEDKKAEIAESSTDLVREHGQLEEQVKEITESRTALKQDTSGAGAEEHPGRTRRWRTRQPLLEDARKERETCAAALSAVQMEAANLTPETGLHPGKRRPCVAEKCEKLDGGVRLTGSRHGKFRTGDLRASSQEIAASGRTDCRDAMAQMEELEAGDGWP